MIEFDNLTKAFGEKHVLTGLSFTAPDGCVTGFVGPNGAGKSTALKILAGVLGADSGRALVDGAEYRSLSEPSAHLGLFLGPEYLPEGMTGSGYLVYVCDLLAVPRGRVPHYLELVGLADAGRQRIKGYSMGMRQRLGLAAALISEAKNLVLDEPVNGLDVEGVKWIRDHLRTAAAQGHTVLLSSHLLSELQLVADRLVILGGGRAVRQGPVASLVEDHDEAVLVDTDQLSVVVETLRAAGARAEVVNDLVRVEGRTVNWVAATLGPQSTPLRGIRAATRAIEDVYLEETGSLHRAGAGSIVKKENE